MRLAENLKQFIQKLDLNEYIASFESFFSRQKPLYMEGDQHAHFRFIQTLSKIDFTAPKSIAELDSQLIHLKKFGVLKLYEIFEFIKIFRYFRYLKSIKTDEKVFLQWIGNVQIEDAIWEVEQKFDDKGNIAQGVDETLDSLELSLKQNRETIRQQLNRLVNSSKLQPYLVDRQVHYINEEECLLVRGGFNHVMKASVTGRSASGFFYVIPESLSKLKDKESELLSRQEEILYQICKELSAFFQKQLGFLKWINREFDRFDHYQARVKFAQAKDAYVILPERDKKIVLSRFRHPALQNPKPTDIAFNKQILMVTGVNAGGKTMLLKSILSAVFMARHLIPMRCDPQKTRIGQFKEIIPILEDPQNVKNDISTFAGRMVAFSDVFGKKDVIVGVDEIELGTDSDEAASLFKVILEELVKRECKIVITTHHKRLAALMAGHESVDLLAALYDEATQTPTYTFLHGTIGKSYAFETAERYGIPKKIVRSAKQVYGEDKERLNELIERSSLLEREMERKKQLLEEEHEKVKQLRLELEAERELQREESSELKRNLEREYFKAIEVAKKAAKEGSQKEVHRQMNRANKYKKRIETEPEEIPLELSIGDRVKHKNSKGVIVGLKAKEATIETDEGIKLRVPRSELRRSGNVPVTPNKTQIQISKPQSVNVKLDLHGLRAEEALEKLDKFLSDSLLAGFDEVLVFHGIGTGKLAHAVKEFLNAHPRVVEFTDAPPHMGGFGAKIIKL